jgi:osmotically inducible protein OsmC
MTQINKHASAHWAGSLKEGEGTVSTESGALKENPYGFNHRFDNIVGTNPEEMIAAAHASCYSMALSMILGMADMTADSIDTKCTVTLEKLDDGFAVTKSHLELTLKVSGASESDMIDAAEKAKDGCPISKLLDCDITLDATYQS